MLIAVLLLIAGASAAVLPHTARHRHRRDWWSCEYDWRMIVSGTVYCDARKTQVPDEVTVTLKDWDDNDDDVATFGGDDAAAKMRATQGHFTVGGMLTDGIKWNRPEPYLLVEGVCPVENYDGVVKRKHFTEKFGLPCDYGCWDDDNGPIKLGGIVIILDGASESPICS
ncbi:hypothetical protein AAVH_16545 [Aphelenchoides avenae]|nr:hypothetical protein AAVH_16545 [Aphelenchus avenae]